jgi:hypothetical protein
MITPLGGRDFFTLEKKRNQGEEKKKWQQDSFFPFPCDKNSIEAIHGG